MIGVINKSLPKIQKQRERKKAKEKGGGRRGKKLEPTNPSETGEDIVDLCGNRVLRGEAEVDRDNDARRVLGNVTAVVCKLVG
jgi:hypothetical protein